MSVVGGATRRRWLVVALVALLLATLPAVVNALPVRVPQTNLDQLIARIRGSAIQSYQGYAVSTGSAGLPALPKLSDVSDLLDGETQLRVWYASSSRWRIDIIGTGTERDTYQAPDRQTVWDYGRNQLAEITGDAPLRLPQGADFVPPDLARRILAAVGTTTSGTNSSAGGRLSALPAQRIGGIAAAGVRITPQNSQTTVAYVDIWADPATGLPLQVAITGRGTTQPFLASRFLEVNLSAPNAAVLTPPAARPGISVVDTDANDLLNTLLPFRLPPLQQFPDGQGGFVEIVPGVTGTMNGDGTWVYTPGTDTRKAFTAYGTGLAQFVVIEVSRQVGSEAMRQLTRAGAVPQQFAHGDGVLIGTPLLSVLVMDDHPSRRNYLLVGLVNHERLRQAGADLSEFGPEGLR